MRALEVAGQARGAGMRNVARALCTSLLCAGLLACGGGGGGGGASSPPPGEAVLNSSGELGPAGGTLGTTDGLRLELPAGALDRPTTVSILSFTPEAGELARYRFAPAGLTLQAPATLRVPVGSLPAGARLYWQVDGETLLLPATRDGNALVAQIRVLGFAANGSVLEAAQGLAQQRQLAERPLSSREVLQATAPAGSGDLVVAVANCQRDIAQLQNRLRNANQLNNLTMATAVFNELEAVTLVCSEVSVQQLQQDACTGLGGAVALASGGTARSFEDVRVRSAALLGAMAYVQETSATCPGNLEDRANALVPAVFNQFVDTLQAGIRDGSLFEDAGPREFSQLFDYEGHCQRLGLDAVCDRFSDQIYPDLLDAMRRASFNECRQNNGTLVVSQLHAMGVHFGNNARFYDHARFSVGDVRRDMSYCTNPRVELRVFDDALDTPVEIEERRQNLQLAPALGDYRPLTITRVPREGSLLMTGVFRGQRCATGESLPADLVVRLSTIELARRTLNGNGNYDFNLQPLDLVISRLFEQTGLSTELDTFRLSFNLEGGRCVLPAERGETEDTVVLDQRETLFEVDVTLPSEELQPGLFTGPVHLNEERFQAGYVRFTETLSHRSSITVTGQFEEIDPIRARLTGARAVVNAEYRVVDRRNFSSPTTGCSFTRIEDSVTTINTGADLPEVFLSGGLEIDRPRTSWRFGSLNVRFSVPSQQRKSTRFESVQGDCSSVDMSPLNQTTNDPTDLNVSFNVSNGGTGPSSFVITGPITEDAQGRQRMAVSGGLNITDANTGDYARTSVSLQLVDR